jgi:hypothetical protein
LQVLFDYHCMTCKGLLHLRNFIQLHDFKFKFILQVHMLWLTRNMLWEHIASYMISGLRSYCRYICCDLLGHVVRTCCLYIISINYMITGLSSYCRYICYDLLGHVASYMISGLRLYFGYHVTMLTVIVCHLDFIIWHVDYMLSCLW